VAIATRRSIGSAMSVASGDIMIEIRLPPPSSPGSRVEIGIAATRLEPGSSPCALRYPRSAPPTTARATSLTVAPGTAFLIRFRSSRS
jgi:hypothetical protein